MPYRTLALNSEIGADLVLVRVSDSAIDRRAGAHAG
jgi:hypothetical protein